MTFDWHAGSLSRDLPLDRDFRITQNVRRFLTSEVGAAATVPRAFHDWLRLDPPDTLGDVVDEWQRRYG